MTYIVSYTPSTLATETNQRLMAIIKRYPRWAILNRNTFVVSHTEETAADIRNRLSEACEPNDSILVINVQRRAAWRIQNSELREWLRDNIE